MFVTANGIRHFVEVLGPQMEPDGPQMRARETVIALHGGPGFDHTLLRPEIDLLGDRARVVLFDRRGEGRSDAGPAELWRLDQWADDMAALQDALGIERPCILGMSFGGVIAARFAARHPERLSRLVLVSTPIRHDRQLILEVFERLGGGRARDIADAYWSNPNAETGAAYREVCMPLYSQLPSDPDVMARTAFNQRVSEAVLEAEGAFDVSRDLRQVSVPVLAIAGELDPVAPAALLEDVRSLIRGNGGSTCVIEGAGHDVFTDAPASAFSAIDRFLREGGSR